jgi:hypothetical protein
MKSQIAKPGDDLKRPQWWKGLRLLKLIGNLFAVLLVAAALSLGMMQMISVPVDPIDLYFFARNPFHDSTCLDEVTEKRYIPGSLHLRRPAGDLVVVVMPIRDDIFALDQRLPIVSRFRRLVGGRFTLVLCATQITDSMDAFLPVFGVAGSLSVRMPSEPSIFGSPGRSSSDQLSGRAPP